MDGKRQYPRICSNKSGRRPYASAERSCFRCVQCQSSYVSVPVLITLGMKFLHENGIVHGDLCGVSPVMSAVLFSHALHI